MGESNKRKALLSRLQYLGEVASTETALFHQVAAAKYGLGITDMKTISILLHDGPLTAGQLSRRLNLTTGAITNVIDRLERRNIAKRTADAEDRRKVVVVVDLEALEGAGNVYASMGAAFEKLLEAYSTEKLEFLVRYHEASIELTKSEIAKLGREKSS
ncbi:MAG: MarR family winged helix-turn-helix transcriptional regulator [Rectinemataceae bacterium]